MQKTSPNLMSRGNERTGGEQVREAEVKGETSLTLQNKPPIYSGRAAVCVLKKYFRKQSVSPRERHHTCYTNIYLSVNFSMIIIET